ncbi:glycoside hydrolase family 25 protein [Aureimonas populi]|uniref:Glycoside hydrolase family 25 protein n=1 Tax=Aureimonas populi TaxID=1701758 RepID=A0ABW5CKS5_9HYPH|nr:glycoside hydrolase family 25 protein [Aureimonas populi]
MMGTGFGAARGLPGRKLATLFGALALATLAACSSASLDARDLGLGYPAPSSLAPFRMAHLSGTRPHHYPVHGIDVSKYQGTINWRAARADGTAFAFIKATEGGDMLDDRFMENWKAAREAGVPRGAYHFFYWCRPGIEQARWFIQNVPRDPEALPPVLDVEWTPFSPTCTRRPDLAEMKREMNAFMDALERHYGVRPIIYVPIDVHRERMVGAFAGEQFWLRAVRDHPSNVYEDREFHFWQYTESGTVAGVRGPVDRNAFSGSERDWQRWLDAHRPLLRTARR